MNRMQYRGEPLTNREEELLTAGMEWLANVLAAHEPLRPLLANVVPELVMAMSGPSMSKERMEGATQLAHKLARAYFIAKGQKPEN